MNTEAEFLDRTFSSPISILTHPSTSDATAVDPTSPPAQDATIPNKIPPTSPPQTAGVANTSGKPLGSATSSNSLMIAPDGSTSGFNSISIERPESVSQVDNPNSLGSVIPMSSTPSRLTPVANTTTTVTENPSQAATPLPQRTRPPMSALIGIIIGVIVFLAMIIALIAVALTRKRREKIQVASENLQPYLVQQPTETRCKGESPMAQRNVNDTNGASVYPGPGERIQMAASPMEPYGETGQASAGNQRVNNSTHEPPPVYTLI
ncbi:hypothetical protein VKT23_017497 [Stygiomarasmius scandens]|uniref:Uncharacterized protein n=1 Tax=Marasmiellus scandens TaxID=2682957 RepID=A0ABR1IW95_9AGAR